jgi:hypothetical protein
LPTELRGDVLTGWLSDTAFSDRRRIQSASRIENHGRFEYIFTLCKYNACAIEKVDGRFDYGEKRVYAMGLLRGLEITVIYTDRGEDERRIISVWRSEPHERRRYWGSIEGEND